MLEKKTIVEELWARQQISALDVDYEHWNTERESIKRISEVSPGCIFTVDVFKGIYDFASENFACIFGFNRDWIKSIRKQGDLLEERIHPDDRDQLLDFQMEHGQFIYTLPMEERNDYQQIFQFRVLNAKQNYVNVISRQQVIRKDKNNKAWIIMGVMDLSPDQTYTDKVRRTVINKNTGEIVNLSKTPITENQLTNREKEILQLIRQGLLSKEIADKLGLSIYTINNHRKNILSKLHANNSLEAIKYANNSGILNSF